jgi:hypothetical protein
MYTWSPNGIRVNSEGRIQSKVERLVIGKHPQDQQCELLEVAHSVKHRTVLSTIVIGGLHGIDRSGAAVHVFRLEQRLQLSRALYHSVRLPSQCVA